MNQILSIMLFAGEVIVTATGAEDHATVALGHVLQNVDHIEVMVEMMKVH